MRINVDELTADEINAGQYLAFKEQLVEGEWGRVCWCGCVSQGEGVGGSVCVPVSRQCPGLKADLVELSLILWSCQACALLFSLLPPCLAPAPCPLSPNTPHRPRC
jgi:hypothetical protein